MLTIQYLNMNFQLVQTAKKCKGIWLMAGPKWGNYFVGPLQFAICYGAVISCTLLGGQSLKVINVSYHLNRGLEILSHLD